MAAFLLRFVFSESLFFIVGSLFREQAVWFVFWAHFLFLSLEALAIRLSREWFRPFSKKTKCACFCQWKSRRTRHGRECRLWSPEPYAEAKAGGGRGGGGDLATEVAYPEAIAVCSSPVPFCFCTRRRWGSSSSPHLRGVVVARRHSCGLCASSLFSILLPSIAVFLT